MLTPSGLLVFNAPVMAWTDPFKCSIKHLAISELEVKQKEPSYDNECEAPFCAFGDEDDY